MERYVSTEDIFNDNARFDAIARLRRELSLPDVQFPERNVSPLTIGIEIEMTWRQAFPDIAQQWPSPADLQTYSQEYEAFANAYDAKDKQLKPILERIKHVIPKVGYDAYWEFSFLPAHNISTTSAELGVLYDAGILRDDQEYSLHMTVAGIENDRDAYAFLCGLEQSGGTSSGRISEAVHSTKGAWARKGAGGILKRRPDELVGKDETGYEFRTLSAQSQSQLNATLNTAADLAHLLHDDYDTWKVYRSSIERSISDQGLQLTPWVRPKDNPLPWLGYTRLLDAIQE